MPKTIIKDVFGDSRDLDEGRRRQVEEEAKYTAAEKRLMDRKADEGDEATAAKLLEIRACGVFAGTVSRSWVDNMFDKRKCFADMLAQLALEYNAQPADFTAEG